MPPKVGETCEIETHFVRPKNTEIVYGLKEPNDGNSGHALICKRNYDDKNMLKDSTLQVNSPYLLRLFKQVIKYYPTVAASFNMSFEMKSPFQMLFHYWDELHKAAEADDLDDRTRMHLNLLLDFMRLELGVDKANVDSMVSGGFINYDFLWTLYRPGDLIYNEQDGHPWLLRLEKTAYEENKRLGKFMEVHCSFTNYDGKDFGKSPHKFLVLQKKSFPADGPAKVLSLKSFPFSFLDRQEEMKERLATRGERFLEIVGAQVKKYDGLAQYLKEVPYSYYDPDMSGFPGVWLPCSVSNLMLAHPILVAR
jgi:hypothetical protein